MPHISGSLDNITLLDALDETLADVMLMRGIPEHIRSDNGPEFIAADQVSAAILSDSMIHR